MKTKTQIIPDLDMTVLEAFNLARANSMYLISDGLHIIIAPHIPAGWREIPIRVKQDAYQKDMPCVA